MSAPIAMFQPRAYRAALATAAAFAATIAAVSPAEAINPQVRNACAGDYLSNCSKYKPESAETRRCMRAVGQRLSKGCITALVSAGEVSKAEIKSRSASSRR
jgi:hypothetical protein